MYLNLSFKFMRNTTSSRGISVGVATRAFLDSWPISLASMVVSLASRIYVGGDWGRFNMDFGLVVQCGPRFWSGVQRIDLGGEFGLRWERWFGTRRGGRTGSGGRSAGGKRSPVRSDGAESWCCLGATIQPGDGRSTRSLLSLPASIFITWTCI